ncbi:hypothetical protein [Chelativorans sp. AA-79]|uniref:hypothetical protein n=1 Tax=Chelativorans sp. AA-79 TaxID=3028735 RepID=UPI0023F8C5C2|nr:hypothetical protein [Chelativorans sp. AA-79]WEX10343.1 hypothetical protein PVE73_05115 [Chelativorans sp. AA-79]
MNTTETISADCDNTRCLIVNGIRFVPASALRELITESVFILRNSPLPDGKFKRFERAVKKAQKQLEAQ